MLAKVVNLDLCPISGLYYGGRAGQKVGILYEGEPWIAKFPRSTRDLVGKHLPAYTSSPVSEYLGSHIFALLGIDAHETLLGFRRGKIVCACKDFTHPDKRLVEFKDIKNSLSDDEVGDFASVPSDGESIFLSDVLATLSLSDVIRTTPGVRERFWDMFVIDAFLKTPTATTETGGCCARLTVRGALRLYTSWEARYSPSAATPSQRRTHRMSHTWARTPSARTYRATGP